MIPAGFKINLKERTRSKGIDAENEVYHKYGKDYLIKDYVQEFKDGTNAKEIIQKAGGLKNLPHAMEQIKDSEISIDMNEDIFTINRKLKLGQYAQRKLDILKAEQEKLAAQMKQEQQEKPESKGE